MNINSVPKDEMTSHLGEVIDTQDSKIFNLYQERRVLFICVAFLFTSNFLF